MAVAKIEILRMPDGMTTLISVKPEDLRARPTYTVTFWRDEMEVFGTLMSGISVKPEAPSADVRWGVLFYGKDGKEIGSLFADGLGKHGYLNGTLVSLQAASPEDGSSKGLRFFLSRPITHGLINARSDISVLRTSTAQLVLEETLHFIVSRERARQRHSLEVDRVHGADVQRDPVTRGRFSSDYAGS